MPWTGQGGYTPEDAAGGLAPGSITLADITDAGLVAATDPGAALSITGTALNVDIEKQAPVANVLDDDEYLLSRNGVLYKITRASLFSGLNPGGFSGTFNPATGLANGTAPALTNANTTSGQWWYATAAGSYDFGSGALSMQPFDFVVRGATAIVIIPNAITPSGVVTFEGRSGTVESVFGDYTTDEVENLALTVAGLTLSQALDNLQAGIDAVPVGDFVTKGGDADAAPLVVGTLDGQDFQIRTMGQIRYVASSAGAHQFLGLTQSGTPTKFLVVDDSGTLFYREVSGFLLSFNGRTGPYITPESGDYTTAQITNVSTAPGATLSDVLATLNNNKVTKGGDAGPLVIGTNDAQSLTLEINNAAALTISSIGRFTFANVPQDNGMTRLYGQRSDGTMGWRNLPASLTSFNGRTAAAVVPTAGDYNSTLVTNLSFVTGANVTEALNTLRNQVNGLAGTTLTLSDITDAGLVAATDPGVALTIAGGQLNVDYTKQSITTTISSNDMFLVMRDGVYHRVSRSVLFSGIEAGSFTGTFNPLTGLDSSGNTVTNATTSFGQWWYASASGTYNFGSGPVEINAFDFVIRDVSAITVIPNAVAADGVLSFNGRAGIVVPNTGDYNSTDITNLSSVTGGSVTLALNALLTQGNSNASQITTLDTNKLTIGGDANGAGISVGTTDAFGFSLIANNAALLTLGSAGTVSIGGIANTPAATRFLMHTVGTGVVTFRDIPNIVTSFNGRTEAAIVPVAGDYTSTLITNLSNVTGATVTDALNQLDADIDAVVAGLNYVTKGGEPTGALTVGTNTAEPVTVETANAARMVFGGAGEITMNGLTSDIAATQFVKRHPSTGRLYATTELDVLYFDTTDLPPATWDSGSQFTVGSGVAVCKHHLNPNDRRMWRLPAGIGSQIIVVAPGGMLGGGSIYLWLGVNSANAVTAFFDNSPVAANRPTGYDYVRLLCPLYVEGGAIRKGTLISGKQEYRYDVDWATSINAVTTAGGGLVSIGVPTYPLLVSVFCTGGATAVSTAATRFSRNSANTVPTITVPSGWSSNFSGDVWAYDSGSAFIHAPWSGELITATQQVRALRSGNYFGAGNYPCLFIKSYSWS